MKEVILIFQVIISIILISLILIQARGTGLGRTFGAGTQSSFSRRGLEKIIFKLTFVIVGVFIVVSLLQLII